MRRDCRIKTIARTVTFIVDGEDGERLSTVVSVNEMIQHLAAGTIITFIENKYLFLETKIRHGLVPR